MTTAKETIAEVHARHARELRERLCRGEEALKRLPRCPACNKAIVGGATREDMELREAGAPCCEKCGMLLPEREVVGTAPTPVPTAELEARIAAALQWCARVRGKTEAQWYVGVDGFDIDELIQLLSGLSSPWLGKKCSDCSATGVCEEEDDVRDACHKIKVKP